jgi:hypothetical protein
MPTCCAGHASATRPTATHCFFSDRRCCGALPTTHHTPAPPRALRPRPRLVPRPPAGTRQLLRLPSGSRGWLPVVLLRRGGHGGGHRRQVQRVRVPAGGGREVVVVQRGWAALVPHQRRGVVEGEWEGRGRGRGRRAAAAGHGRGARLLLLLGVACGRGDGVPLLLPLPLLVLLLLPRLVVGALVRTAGLRALLGRGSARGGGLGGPAVVPARGGGQGLQARGGRVVCGGGRAVGRGCQVSARARAGWGPGAGGRRLSLRRAASSAAAPAQQSRAARPPPMESGRCAARLAAALFWTPACTRGGAFIDRGVCWCDLVLQCCWHTGRPRCIATSHKARRPTTHLGSSRSRRLARAG